MFTKNATGDIINFILGQFWKTYLKQNTAMLKSVLFLNDGSLLFLQRHNMRHVGTNTHRSITDAVNCELFWSREA